MTVAHCYVLAAGCVGVLLRWPGGRALGVALGFVCCILDSGWHHVVTWVTWLEKKRNNSIKI